MNYKELVKVISQRPICVVSTVSGSKIRNRMMHFAVSDNLVFFLSSLKSDPKVKQIIANEEISLLVYIPGKEKEFVEDIEIEVTGYARVINDNVKKEEAIKLLLNRSPVVAQLYNTPYMENLLFIEVLPHQIKYRCVKDILQGIPPKVYEFTKDERSSSDFNKLKKKISIWIAETRYPFVSVSMLTALLGGIVAWVRTGSLKIFDLVLTVVGVVFIHLGSNIANDYFDHKSGNDEANNEFVRPFTGGSRIIQSGLLTPLEVLIGSLIFFFFGASIGIFLTIKYGLPILILGLIGVTSGFFYSAPIINFSKRGIGELLVGINFGLLAALGSYYVQAERFSLEVAWLSLLPSIMVSAILLINEIPDYTADKITGKNTLIVRFGKSVSYKILTIIVLIGYLLLITGIMLKILPPTVILGLISLPFVLKAIEYTKRFYEKPFDMAVGNGLMILSFNILCFIFINIYLSMLSNKLYLLVSIIISGLYLLWNYNIISQQREAFIRLKNII